MSGSRPSDPGLATDARGVSAVVGFMLVFAMLITLLGVLQVSAVPTWNEHVEQEHNERLQADLLALHDDVLAVAATGSDRSRTVRVGVRYPLRPFLLNPPPASGTLRTGESGTIRFSNARAAGETGKFWNGTDHSYETRPLVYRPAYNEYADAPRTRLEGGLLVNRFEGADRPLTDQRLIRGDRISLTTIGGSFAANRPLSESVSVTPASAPTRRVSVRDDGDPITIRVPTALPRSLWSEQLADQRTEAGGHVRAVEDAPGDAVEIVLEPGVTYEFELARVTLDERPTRESPAYATAVGGTNAVVPQGGSRLLEVELMDRFNAPVAGAGIEAEVVSGRGDVTQVSPTTNADGRAVVRYDAPNGAASDGVAVRVGTAGETSERHRVTFEINVYGSQSGYRGSSGASGNAQ